jgi:hypothetical protein
MVPGPEPLILAITTTDTLIHVGRGADLLPHVAQEKSDYEGTGQTPPDWQFYDAKGADQQLVHDGEGHPTGFEPVDPSAPDPGDAVRALLVDRIRVFQARVQVVLDQRIADGDYEGDPEARRRAPVVDGELTDVLAALEVLGGRAKPPGEPDPGSWLHNLWHAAFG